MDKIEKFLQRLTTKELQRVLAVIHQIQSQDLTALDIKKIANRKDILRVRVGSIRIFIIIDGRGKYHIFSIQRRSDVTYN